jgi:hypothetical protein
MWMGSHVPFDIQEKTMTRALGRCLFCSIALGICALSSIAPAGEAPTTRRKAAASSPVAGFHWCHQVQRPITCEKSRDALLLLAGVTETESNDTVGTAQILAFGSGNGQSVDVDVNGSLSSGTDVDFFRFVASKGDIIGIACIGQGLMDSVVAIMDSAGTEFFENDDGVDTQSLYPVASPWPGVTPNSFDSALTFVIPSDGDYVIKVSPWSELSIGAYTLKLCNRRALLEAQESPGKQTIFIDFDGASIDRAIFGGPSIMRTLSPLSSFLVDWGLTAADQNAVIDAILATIEENFDSMRLASLNNDLRTGGPLGSFDITFLNSRDDPEPFGASNVSRVIVGGTMNELLMQTIGIAQSIDPGNYDTKETAVVLLDLLSQPLPPIFPGNSLNELQLAPGKSIIDLIGVAVGNIVSHEIGHYLGNFHTTNQNEVPNIMDEGGQFIGFFSGVGPNGIFGDSDDVDVDFVTDAFSLFEDIAYGSNNTAVNTAFGLSTGKLAAVPPTVTDSVPPRETDLGKLPQISVTFSEPISGITADQLTVNGSVAHFVSGNGDGPYLFSGFLVPPNGDVSCALAGGGIKDAVGNTFVGDVLTFKIKDCNQNGLLDDDDISGGTSTDCNGNRVADECDETILRSREIGPLEINSGDSIALGDFAPFLGGDPPYTFKWTIRGNPSGDESADLNTMFGPLPPDTYVPELEVTDGHGCKLVSFLTIKVIGDDGTTGGGTGGSGGSNFGGANGGGTNAGATEDCGQGTLCGASSGGLVTMIGAYVGLFGYRRRRK